MQRKLFLFLEKLQISQKERLAIGCLSGVLVILGALNLAIEKRAVYDPAYYDELERIFSERSRNARSEHHEILARYRLHGTEEYDMEEFLETEGYGVEEWDGFRRSDRDSSDQKAGIININTADAGELQDLPGIGPAYAARIIDWRGDKGPFTSIEQLVEIKGIGEKRLADLKDFVIVGDSLENSRKVNR